MPDYRYVLYDTAAFGTSADTEHVLFQVAQGGDSTHTEDFTNMRGAGALPGEEAFSVDKISVAVDGVHGANEADVAQIWDGAFIEVRVADKTVFKAPARLCAEASAYGGAYTQGTAADATFVGLLGNGYSLDIPIEIPGGTAFRVRLYQDTALTASTQVKVCLHGILTRP